MKNIKNKIPVLLLLVLLLQGCFIFSIYKEDPLTGEMEKDSSPPIYLRPFGYKKIRERTLRPPIIFVKGLREYRIEMNSFPLNITNFQNHSTTAKKAVDGLREAGYTKLKIEYWSLDSFRLAWYHPYVHEKMPSPGNYNIDASGVFIFTYKNGSFDTKTEFK